MNYVTIKLTYYPETDRIMGCDGRVYRISPWKQVTLPYLNARVFLQGGVAELVDLGRVDGE